MSPGPLTSDALRRMAEIFLSDYEQHFRIVYEDAALISIPLEPGEEVRNAFDHFSEACWLAAEVDAGNPIAEPEDFRGQVWTNIGQARRHLSVGRYFCIQHQIVNAFRRIRLELPAAPEFQPRFDDLVRRLRRIGGIEKIVIERIFKPDLLDRWVEEFEAKIEALTHLLNDFLILLDDLFPEAPPATKAP
jgi:hypothetical protein